MIRLHNLKKYYNKNKSNEIRAIDDVSLTLPSTGLVVLLGPSGSGKTTLLNVLGGLDSVQQGTIDFDGLEINKYKSSVWDAIRNRDVGYIFQNYNLLTNLTVYENIAMTLRMIGITDKDEIDKRIDYILENINMSNYRKRRAYQLSGGQQQRVAIARALAKNPKVIIADEPTGNLDSKNTVDIMNIIRSIADTKLVVLVTHEEDIATYYADRIIRVKDGKIISDNDHVSAGDVSVKHDSDIYLKDLREISTMDDENSSLKLYTDESEDTTVNVRLIIKNNTLYVDLKNDDYNNVQLLDNDSEINIYDTHFEAESKEDFIDRSFDINTISNDNISKEKHRVISLKEAARLAWNRIKETKLSTRIFYFGFFLGSILIAIAVGMLSHIVTTDPADFQTDHKQIVLASAGDYDLTDTLALQDLQHIEYVSYFSSIGFSADLPTLFQSSNVISSLEATPIRDTELDSAAIMQGRNIENHFEVVINQNIADDFVSKTNFRNLGISNYDDLMQIDYYVTLQTNSVSFQVPFNIVGISDGDNPNIYMTKELALMIKTNIPIYEIYEDDITLDQGTFTNDGYYIKDNLDQIDNLGLYARQFLANNMVSATATYTADSTVPSELVPYDVLLENFYQANFTSPNNQIRIFSTDINATLSYFEDQGISAVHLFDQEMTQFQEDRLVNSLGTLVFTLVVLTATSIAYYFMIRSSLFSRIYEVSVYRALGVSKMDIHTIFITEIVMLTLMTSFLGYSITTFFLYRIQFVAEDYFDFLHISFLSIIGGILLIFTVNIVSGLIPVMNLLRKTPATILSKYDF